MEWKTIDTAPQNGMPLLLWIDTDDGGEPMILYRNKCGEWIYEGEPLYAHGFYLKATHWQPLPEPPK